jgi:N6-L-threonylcarbamoyladenine synthase
MRILGIETSCDETAAAIVESHSDADGVFAVYSAIATSLQEHVKIGGIIPEVAARKQIEYILPVIEKVVRSGRAPKNVDAIAVTVGPGLIGSLLVGVETAKTLSFVWNKPIVPVNHLVAHIYANWVNQENLPHFPAVAMVVSGGHTDLVIMKDHNKIKRIGGTRDDAAGEAFDKTARLLGLPYPGGPSISAASEKFLDEKLNLFPRPMIDSDNLDMSFSGLKTSVKNYLNDNSNLIVDRLAAEVQEAIVDTLVAKAQKAVEIHKPKSFILAGGVSANIRLREKIKATLNKVTEVFIPEPKYTTDNAVMVASAAYYNYKPAPWQKITANPSMLIETNV